MDVLPRQAADAVVNMAADQMLLEHYPATLSAYRSHGPNTAP
jgi:hypothetical protein